MAVLAVSGFLFWASYSIRSCVYVKAYCKGAIREKVVALTFDDGPDPASTPKVLDILREHNIKALFFVIGERAERHPDLIERIVGEGHAIGNHSYSHTGSFPMKSARAMIGEMERTDAVIENITGFTPDLFRPPFGVTNPIVGKAVRQRGYKVVGWNIRSLDTTGRSDEKVMGRIKKGLRPGAVILLHDDRERAPRLLGRILDLLAMENYSTQRPDILLGLKNGHR